MSHDFIFKWEYVQKSNYAQRRFQVKFVRNRDFQSDGSSSAHASCLTRLFIEVKREFSSFLVNRWEMLMYGIKKASWQRSIYPSIKSWNLTDFHSSITAIAQLRLYNLFLSFFTRITYRMAACISPVKKADIETAYVRKNNITLLSIDAKCSTNKFATWWISLLPRKWKRSHSRN